MKPMVSKVRTRMSLRDRCLVRAVRSSWRLYRHAAFSVQVRGMTGAVTQLLGESI